MSDFMKITIAEHFYSLQGEGKFIGTPSLFIRLAGCNLKCGFRASIKNSSWICDTKNVWNKGKTLEVNDFILFLLNEYSNVFNLGNYHIVITGGEPLLQQNSVFYFIKELSRKLEEDFKNKPSLIEIETNGTIDIDSNLRKLKNLLHFNISPKMINSGEIESLRRCYIDLKQDDFNVNEKINGIYKFVLNKDDISSENEIKEFIKKQRISIKDVFIMPAGETLNEIQNNLVSVAEFCKLNGFNFTTRLHIQIWNKKTGV